MNELTINAFIDEFNEFQKAFQEKAKRNSRKSLLSFGKKILELMS